MYCVCCLSKVTESYAQERVGPGDVVIVPAGAKHNVRVSAEHLTFMRSFFRSPVPQQRTDPANPIHGEYFVSFIQLKSLTAVIQVYAPAEHKADTVHGSLEEGDRLEEEGKDEPPSWAADLHKKE